MGSYIIIIGASEQQLVSESFFWLGAFMLSSSLVLLWNQVKNKNYLVLIIAVSAFFIYSIGFLRFPYYGADIVGEYDVAIVTQQFHRWPIELITSEGWDSYFSCLSVTIFPAMVSSVTGLPMMMVFKILIPLLATLVVVGAFLVIRIVFDERIAALSSIMFILSGNSELLRELLREDVALFFLFLSILLLYARYRSNKLSVSNRMSSLFLAVVFLLVVPTAHYTMVYFTLLFLLTVFVAERLGERFGNIVKKLRFKSTDCSTTFKDDRNAIVAVHVLTLAAVADFAWLIFIAYPVFSFNIQEAAGSFHALLGLGNSQYHFYVTHALVSSLGTYETIINWIERGFTIVGFFLALKLFNKVKVRTFTLWGGLMLLVMLIVAVVPDINIALPLDRVYLIGLVAFSSFTALTLIEISKKLLPTLRSWTILFSVAIVVAIFFTSFMPIIYLPEAAATKQYVLSIEGHYNLQDLEFAQWLQNYTSKTLLFSSDYEGSRICEGFAFRKCAALEFINSSDVISEVRSSVLLGQYFILPIVTDNGMWFGGSFNTVSVQPYRMNEMLDNIHADTVYSNGRNLLIVGLSS